MTERDDRVPRSDLSLRAAIFYRTPLDTSPEASMRTYAIWNEPADPDSLFRAIEEFRQRYPDLRPEHDLPAFKCWQPEDAYYQIPFRTPLPVIWDQPIIPDLTSEPMRTSPNDRDKQAFFRGMTLTPDGAGTLARRISKGLLYGAVIAAVFVAILLGWFTSFVLGVLRAMGQ
jgi:hypothetical protein